MPGRSAGPHILRRFTNDWSAGMSRTSRRIVYVVLMIVVLLLIWQFLGSL
ncbi:hypothetical protein [Bradyrhizobium neotropicale]|nr:hypothetical protein [Bradyrhizobium neotropicale]